MEKKTQIQTLILFLIYSSNSNAGLFTSKYLHNKSTVASALSALARLLNLFSWRAVSEVWLCEQCCSWSVA